MTAITHTAILIKIRLDTSHIAFFLVLSLIFIKYNISVFNNSYHSLLFDREIKLSLNAILLNILFSTGYIFITSNLIPFFICGLLVLHHYKHPFSVCI